MYSILESDNSISRVYYLNYKGSNGLGLDFSKGLFIEPLANENSLFIDFECKKIKLPDYFEVQGVPIANEKLIKAFEDGAADANNFQIFPVEIQFENGKMSGYYLFNIVGQISCMDTENSRFSKFGPSIARIFDLKLNPELTNDIPMFREQKYTDIIFVSQKIKKSIKAQSITGCELRQANGWNDNHRF